MTPNQWWALAITAAIPLISWALWQQVPFALSVVFVAGALCLAALAWFLQKAPTTPTLILAGALCLTAIVMGVIAVKSTGETMNGWAFFSLAVGAGICLERRRSTGGSGVVARTSDI
ncbi:hypothetical protein [Glutamicibacter sp. PS]|uniref:hypothetical protein n=1 Tax=Glutamicibacter sp. PS TaxID=3075634 RepID=UPI00284AF37E|nr:hypothetical protein [Glutamicibacter sp. PS]MDR4533495.1 hypothetical protein [Glutamicibacter sp. PS]